MGAFRLVKVHGAYGWDLSEVGHTLGPKVNFDHASVELDVEGMWASRNLV